MKPAQILRAVNDFIDKCERRLRKVHSTFARFMCAQTKLSLYGHEEKKGDFRLKWK